MCGVIYFSSKEFIKSDVSKLKKIFKVSSVRGSQSSGLFINKLNERKIEVFKSNQIYQSIFSDSSFKSIIKSLSGNISFCGHTRMATNGSHYFNENNQPVMTSRSLLIHNGIVCNHDILKRKKKNQELDSIALSELIDQKNDIKNLNFLNEKVEGTLNIIYKKLSSEEVVFYTNHGSLYYVKKDKEFVVLSEKMFFKKLGYEESEIKKVKPLSTLIFNEEKFTFSESINTRASDKKTKINYRDIFQEKPVKFYSKPSKNDFNYLFDRINQLKRCSSCILPETFPFISFNENNVCNYCTNYNPIKLLGKKKLIKDLGHVKNNLLVTFSGGRDSSYALHYLKNLGYRLTAYSYDWGLITDLARRNQSRLCQKLEIEHILVSANIEKKRNFVKKNLLTWLNNPIIGIVPILMAGDKQYYEFANKIFKNGSYSDIVLGENKLETTHFKTGYLGIPPNHKNYHTFSINFLNKLKLLGFYGKQYLINPGYINESLLDTLRAFLIFYFQKKDYLNIYDYINWDEKIIDKTLLNCYNWEFSGDNNSSSWRIGDGTAAFYNYVYLNYGGFTEFDTFKSNEIREGKKTRNEAVKSINVNNEIRINDFIWYCETVGVDPKYALKKIHEMDRLF